MLAVSVLAHASRLGLPANVDGVVVRQVVPGSAAADKGIRPGDVITGITVKGSTKPVHTANDLREIKELAQKEADREARKITALAIQRMAADLTAETTVSVVQLPSDSSCARM